MMYDARQPFCNGLIFPVAWNKAYKRDLLLKHYCTDERIRMGEDNAFVFECLVESDSAYFCNDILYNYNQLNVGSMIHSYDPNRFDNNRILTDYIEKNIGGKDEILDKQINAFKAYWLIMAVMHEVKSDRKLIEARNHIRSKIKSNESTKDIKLEGLPSSAKLYIVLLKARLYTMALILARLVNKKRSS